VAVDESATGEGIQDSMDINDFLRTGIDSGGPMGVSSQAGKSRPQTGVFFRDGTDVARDKRTGSVSAEIIVGTKSNPSPLLVNYVSPWPLATGSVYDIECRDSKTGDGAFVSVVLDTSETKGKSIQDLSNDFFCSKFIFTHRSFFILWITHKHQSREKYYVERGRDAKDGIILFQFITKYTNGTSKKGHGDSFDT